MPWIPHDTASVQITVLDLHETTVKCWILLYREQVLCFMWNDTTISSASPLRGSVSWWGLLFHGVVKTSSMDWCFSLVSWGIHPKQTPDHLQCIVYSRWLRDFWEGSWASHPITAALFSSPFCSSRTVPFKAHLQCYAANGAANERLFYGHGHQLSHLSPLPLNVW